MREETFQRLMAVASAIELSVASVRTDTDSVVATRNHVDVIKHFDRLRFVVERIKDARKALDEIEDRLSREQVPEVMRENNVKTITVEGVGRVSINHRFSCSMLDKEAGMDWLRKNGHEGLIQPTVNSSSLSAFAKNMLEVEGKELPPDVFKTGTMPHTSITKVK